MLLGCQDQVGHVSHVVAEEEPAFPTRDFAPAEKHRQAGQRHGQHHPDIEGQQRGGHRQAEVARHQTRQTQAAQNVEGVAAHHITHGDVAFALDGRGDGRGDLGHGGARSHDGQPDDEVAHAHLLGEGHRGGHQRIGAQHQRHEPGSNQAELRGQAGVPAAGFGRLHIPFETGLRGLRLAARLDDQEGRVNEQQTEEQSAVPKRQLAIQAQRQQQQRGAQHDGHLLPDELLVHHQRRDQRADAQDEQYVEDVAADHVANGDVGVAVQHSAHRYGHLGCAGTKRHDGEAHHQRRNAEAQCQLRRPAHQQARAQHQAGQTCSKQQQLVHFGVPGNQ